MIKQKQYKEPNTDNPRVVKTVNCKINKFKGFTEIVYYKEKFDVRYGSPDYDIIYIDEETGETTKNSRARNFIKNGNLLEPIRDGATIDKLATAIKSSCTRAKDNFYGYGLCNDWFYFVTTTIDINKYFTEEMKAKHGSIDDIAKYFWHLFKEKLKYHFKGIKVLCVPERCENGQLHFHSLFGNCDIEKFLVPAINKKTGKLIFDKGSQIFNLVKLWEYGFTTVKKIPQGENQLENRMKAINYLIEYTTKQSNIGYNQKKYYRTNNLTFKNSELTLIDDIEKFTKEVGAEHYKENEKMIVCRVFDKN